MAGLKQIPESYYEAASIDGAVGWRRFFFITLPLLKPVLLFVVVMNVIGASGVWRGDELAAVPADRGIFGTAVPTDAGAIGAR
jgi:ABC-type spermidine/putrescine transport system permease subunit I